MDIRFTVNDNKYQLKSDTRQMILNAVGTVKEGKNKGNECFSHVGYFRNEFEALKHLLTYEKYISECETMVELEKLTKDTITQIKELMKIYSIKV